MFDLGWAEMAVIMLVALIVIGPKDLPKVARTIGQWTGKARALARDFQRSLDDMAREAELDEIKKSIDGVSKGSLNRAVKNMVDPEDEFERAFDMEEGAASRQKGVKPPPKHSNVKKPAATKALTTSAEPTMTPSVGNGTDDWAPQPIEKASTDKVPAESSPAAKTPAAKSPVEAGADEAGSARG